jgi:hypothetical protein
MRQSNTIPHLGTAKSSDYTGVFAAQKKGHPAMDAPQVMLNMGRAD